MHLAVAILRVDKGLDYSRVLGEDSPSTFNEPRTIVANDSTADLLANDKASIHGSSDSLSRNVSQGLTELHYFCLLILLNIRNENDQNYTFAIVILEKKNREHSYTLQSLRIYINILFHPRM